MNDANTPDITHVSPSRIAARGVARTFQNSPRKSAMFWKVRATPRAAVRMVEAADHVENGRLARAVGSDDGGDGPLADVQRHVAHRLHAAERLRDLANLELYACAVGLPLSLATAIPARHDSHRLRRL